MYFETRTKSTESVAKYFNANLGVLTHNYQKLIKKCNFINTIGSIYIQLHNTSI